MFIISINLSYLNLKMPENFIPAYTILPNFIIFLKGSKFIFDPARCKRKIFCANC